MKEPLQTQHRPPLLIILLIFFSLASSSSTWACDVPVFRYALERWSADPYGCLIIEDHPLNDEETEVLEELKKWSIGDERQINLWIGKMSREDMKGSGFGTISEQFPKGEKNQMVLVYPQVAGISKAIWAGPINQTSAQILWNSPERKDIVTELSSGTSAVFYYLESGNAEKDQEIQTFLKSSFEILQNGFSLPQTVISRTSSEIPDDPSNRLRTDVPFKLEFKLKSLPLKTQDPILRNMLHGLEEGLPADAPMVFAIFGRGRTIGPITGENLNKEVLLQLASYLCGRCSCQVKAQNPGIDILLNQNWDKILFPKGNVH